MTPVEQIAQSRIGWFDPSRDRRLTRGLQRSASSWRKLVLKLSDKRCRITQSEIDKYCGIYDRLMKICQEITDGDHTSQSANGLGVQDQSTTLEPGTMQETEKSTSFEKPVTPTNRNISGQHLHNLLKPWRNPKALRAASPAIIEDLLRQQQLLEEQILSRRNYSPLLLNQTVIFFLTMAITCGLMLVALYGAIDVSFAHWIRSFFHSATARIGLLTFTEKLMFTSIAAWLLGTGILWTSLRR